MNTAIFYSAVVILLSCISLGFAAESAEPFKCFVCSSDTPGKKCGIGNDVDQSFLIDCKQDDKTFGGGEAGVNYTFCRKIITWVDFDVNSQKGGIERVFRRCGYKEDEKRGPDAPACVYRGGLGGRQRVCTCSESGCNSAPSIPINSFITVLSIFVPMLIITLFQNK